MGLGRICKTTITTISTTTTTENVKVINNAPLSKVNTNTSQRQRRKVSPKPPPPNVAKIKRKSADQLITVQKTGIDNFKMIK